MADGELSSVPGVLIALIMVGILLGVGIVVLDGLADNVRVATQVTDEQHIFWSHNFTNLANSKVTTTSVTAENASNSSQSVTLQFDATGTFAARSAKLATASNSFNGTRVNITYQYGAAGTAATGVLNTAAAVDDFPAWLSIIIVVLAAAIIMTIVIKGLGGR